MTDEQRDRALRLQRHLQSKGAGSHTVVGVGSTGEALGRVPALHVYITPRDNRKCERLIEFEDMPVVWHVSGPARALG